MCRMKLLFLLCIGFSLACGGGGGGEPSPTDTDAPPAQLGTPNLPTALLTVQERLTKQWYEGCKDGRRGCENTEPLQQLITQQASKGYNEFVTAGVTEDDSDLGVKWAVYRNPTDDSERIFTYMCQGTTDCTSARLLLKDGVSYFLALNGDSLNRTTVGRPVLSKVLPGMDHEDFTTLHLPLTEDEEPVTVELGERKFVIANAYGDLFGLTTPILKKVAEDSGAFTKVQSIQYARPTDITGFLRGGSPLDVLVWVGASVLEDMGDGHKTIGMTVNRGGFGDETLPASAVKEAFKNSPFGGPGLVILVGEQSWGDGSGHEMDNLSLFKEFSEGGNRTIVGFQGRGDTVHLLDAANHFANHYINGDTLGDSLAAANDVLIGHGSSATMTSNHATEPERLFLGRLDKFWGDLGDPQGVQTTLYVSVTNKCEGVGGTFYSEPENQANFFVNVDFEGPFFEGSRVSSDVELDVTVRGVVTGTSTGDRVYLWIEGDLKKSVKMVSLYGMGTIIEKSDEENPMRIFFDGEATAGPYYNEELHTCYLISPMFSGTTSQPSFMDLPYKKP